MSRNYYSVSFKTRELQLWDVQRINNPELFCYLRANDALEYAVRYDRKWTNVKDKIDDVKKIIDNLKAIIDTEVMYKIHRNKLGYKYDYLNLIEYAIREGRYMIALEKAKRELKRLLKEYISSLKG